MAIGHRNRATFAADGATGSEHVDLDSLVTSPNAKPLLRQSSRLSSGNSSCNGSGRMHRAEGCGRRTSWPSRHGHRHLPSRSSSSGSSPNSCSSRLALASPAVPPPTITTPTSIRSSSPSSPCLTNSLSGSTGRRGSLGAGAEPCAGGHDQPPLLGLDRVGQLGHDLVEVADDPEVRELEDRRIRVLVDRDDVLRGLHPDLVLDRAGDPGGEVELGRRPSCRSGRSGPRRDTSRRRRPRGSRRPRCSAERRRQSSASSKPSALPRPRPPATRMSAPSMSTSRRAARRA